MVKDWERLESRHLADYRVFQVRQDVARSPRTDQVHDIFLLQMETWINVIAVTSEGKVVMIHQYRHGTEEIALEIPGGVVEASDRSMAAAASRELLEETGYEAQEMIFLGRVAPNPALQNNWCYSFLALGAFPVGQQRLDEGEDIEVEEIELERIPRLIRAGRVNHGLVVVAFYFLDQYRREHPDVRLAGG